MKNKSHFQLLSLSLLILLVGCPALAQNEAQQHWRPIQLSQKPANFKPAPPQAVSPHFLATSETAKHNAFEAAKAARLAALDGQLPPLRLIPSRIVDSVLAKIKATNDPGFPRTH